MTRIFLNIPTLREKILKKKTLKTVTIHFAILESFRLYDWRNMEIEICGLKQSNPRLKAKSISYDEVKKKEFHCFLILFKAKVLNLLKIPTPVCHVPWPITLRDKVKKEIFRNITIHYTLFLRKEQFI